MFIVAVPYSAAALFRLPAANLLPAHFETEISTRSDGLVCD